MKDVILTGIRANNDLHIGNYFGAMLPIVDMAKKHAGEYQINMFIPDLHSFTTPVEYGKPLYDSVLNNARVYAAAGLPFDDDSINLYRQSFVPAHSEMTWILDCFTGYGQMARMTQFKDKSHQASQAADQTKAATLEDALNKIDESIQLKESVSMGLFNYPVLMASDILLYGAKYVPVGDDQTQHLEFARDIAGRMNNKFGELFVVPEPVSKQHEFFGKDQGLRIKDLLDPTKKMSKSDESGAGVIFLSDTPDEAKKKIMRATTDDKASVNYDKTTQPGISNLLEILALLRGKTVQEVEPEFKGQSKYGDFKAIVADEMAKFLEDFQRNLANVDNTAVLAKLEASERAMNIQANETLLRVQKAVGLRL